VKLLGKRNCIKIERLFTEWKSNENVNMRIKEAELKIKISLCDYYCF
jgi:hypothetical protein